MPRKKVEKIVPDYNSPIFKNALIFAESIALRYYNYYSDIYKMEGLEKDDILQEARLRAVQKYGEWLKNPRKFNLNAALSVEIGFNGLNKIKNKVIFKRVLFDLPEKDKLKVVRIYSLGDAENLSLQKNILKEKSISNEEIERLKPYLSCNIEDVSQDILKTIYEKIYKNDKIENEDLKRKIDIEDLRAIFFKKKRTQKEIKIFELYYVKNEPIIKIAKKVGLTIQRIRKKIESLTRDLFQTNNGENK